MPFSKTGLTGLHLGPAIACTSITAPDPLSLGPIPLGGCTEVCRQDPGVLQGDIEGKMGRALGVRATGYSDSVKQKLRNMRVIFPVQASEKLSFPMKWKF